MGNRPSRTVQTLRLDAMEEGSSQKKRTMDEIAFLTKKMLEAESEHERHTHATEIEKLKRSMERSKMLERDAPVNIKVF